ncbi:hypothetical protein JGS6364_32941 [[Clostridium] sordellii]|uniref:hypothetical protein n=1 Tax=Paraclostridium sordellii TaxID=1505 RepID=UPI0003027F19|nr:hypothetical protein [Paeniclostridium sordellii]TAN63509.1 hypothetical protein WS9_015690 [Paeniclostridium sordellii 8483]CEK31652.1 hypothetical protein JGS6364_32941 [[Clostridium] sordellii] [Paeniclostridium sordellii]
MDNMNEMRSRVGDGRYNLTLEVAAPEYFNIYEDVDTKSGEDLVRNYLRSNSDDGCFDNIKINYNKARNSIRVTTELNYNDNEHKDYSNRGRLM